MSTDSKSNQNTETSVVDVTAESRKIQLKQKAGDLANRWLERNRSLVLRQTPVWAQGFAILMISLGSVGLIGSILFKIDEVVTVGGQLKSIGGTLKVMTPAGGRVAEVFYKDGQKVEKGQPLLRFDTTEAAAEKEMLTSQINFENLQLEAQLKTLKSQEESLENRQQVYAKQLDTQKTILESMEILVSQGGFQKIQFLRQQDQVYQLEKQAEELIEQKNRIRLESDKLVLQSKKSIDQMKTALKKAELRLKYQNVVAPVSGVVFDPQAAVEGVLQSGQRILSLVPQEGFYAEIFVPNKDIGYIQLNQKAKVRVDAFPFSRYGEIPARVTQIAADALPPTPTENFYRFPIKLELERSSLVSGGSIIPLKAGMSITTNLKLRDKRVISLISDVFVDQTDSIRSLRQQ